MDFASYLSPLLSRICEYAAFRRAGVEIPYETLLSEIHAYLGELDSKCRTNPQLQELYRKVERSVIFFIDYTIKEGGFSYSERYSELARNFNELSGDEKFFDLLQESLDRRDDPQIFKLYYLMLGLGFDGVFKRDRTKVLELMNRLKQEFPPSFDPRTEPLCPELKEQLNTKSTVASAWWERIFSRTGLLILVGIMLVALIFNIAGFNWSIAEFTDTLEQVSSSASPYNYSTQN